MRQRSALAILSYPNPPRCATSHAACFFRSLPAVPPDPAVMSQTENRTSRASYRPCKTQTDFGPQMLARPRHSPFPSSLALIPSPLSLAPRPQCAAPDSHSSHTCPSPSSLPRRSSSDELLDRARSSSVQTRSPELTAAPGIYVHACSKYRPATP